MESVESLARAHVRGINHGDPPSCVAKVIPKIIHFEGTIRPIANSAGGGIVLHIKVTREVRWIESREETAPHRIRQAIGGTRQLRLGALPHEAVKGRQFAGCNPCSHQVPLHRIEADDELARPWRRVHRMGHCEITVTSITSYNIPEKGAPQGVATCKWEWSA